MKLVWVDGELGAQVPVEDLGFQQGLGVFETIGLFAGELPLWKRHLARLCQGAELLGIEPVLPADLRATALDLLQRNGDDVLRLSLSAGDGEVARLVLNTRKRQPSDAPLRLGLAGWRRPLGDPLTRIKCLSYAFEAVQLARARKSGHDDAVILDTRGAVLESCRHNLLFRVGRHLMTPSLGDILPGIARAVLLDGLRARGEEVVEELIPWTTAQQAEAVWASNAVSGPRPAWISSPRQAQPDAVLETIWNQAVSGSSPS